MRKDRAVQVRPQGWDLNRELRWRRSVGAGSIFVGFYVKVDLSERKLRVGPLWITGIRVDDAGGRFRVSVVGENEAEWITCIEPACHICFRFSTLVNR